MLLRRMAWFEVFGEIDSLLDISGQPFEKAVAETRRAHHTSMFGLPPATLLEVFMMLMASQSFYSETPSQTIVSRSAMRYVVGPTEVAIRLVSDKPGSLPEVIIAFDDQHIDPERLARIRETALAQGWQDITPPA